MSAPLVLAADGLTVPLSAAAVPPRATLSQCLLLAALLHLWLLALVGTTPGSGLPPTESAWVSGGALRIRLDGPGRDDSPGLVDQPLPATGPVGRAPEPRFGGAVRDAVPRPSPEPGAAQIGAWGPQPTPDPLRPRSAAVPAVAEPAAQATTAPSLLRSERPSAPALPAEASVQPSQPAVPDPPPARPTDEGAGSSTAPRLAPEATRQAPVLQQAEPSLRDIADSAQSPAAVAQPQPAPPRSEPAAGVRAAEPARPAPSPPAESEPPATRPPQALPSLAPPAVVAPPPAAPLTPVLPPTPVAPSPQPAAAPAAAAVPPPPATAPVPPAVDAAEPAPAPAPPARTPPVPSTLRPVEAVDLPPAAVPPLQAPPVRAVEPRVPPTIGVATAAPSAAGVARPPQTAAAPPAPPTGGSPGAGVRLGPDRATAPAASASAPLRLDLPSARAALQGLASPRLLNLVPPPPERKSPLAEGIEKAAKPDCRKAYAGMGLLGVVPLAADAMRDGGCRW